jgi:hypothetical protein
MKPADVRRVRTLDVRPLLACGEDPRNKVLAAAVDIGPNEGLIIIAPFLPSPLIERLQMDGFSARPERLHDGSWQTFFWRE